MDARLKEIGSVYNDMLKEACMSKQTNLSGDIFLPPKYTVLGDGEGGNPLYGEDGATLVINEGGGLKFIICLGNTDNYFAQYEGDRQITYSNGANMLGCSKFLDVFLNAFEDIAPEKLEQISALFPA